MQRVHWTVDLLEAHVIAGFLRAEGVDAEVFDADFLRQDWLAAIAYGGYRVVTADEDAVAARKLIAHRQANDFALDEDDPEKPACPRCSSIDVDDDPVPRRVASAILFFFPHLSVFMFPLVPFKWRYRCSTCGKRWQALPRHSFRDLARQADAADAAR
jgi:DNA-directed RNA polymerase subunit RPC12/RpoP